MKRYVFRSYQFVHAENEAEAREKFANDSFDFAANAECEELQELED